GPRRRGGADADRLRLRAGRRWGVPRRLRRRPPRAGRAAARREHRVPAARAGRDPGQGRQERPLPRRADRAVGVVSPRATAARRRRPTGPGGDRRRPHDGGGEHRRASEADGSLPRPRAGMPAGGDRRGRRGAAGGRVAPVRVRLGRRPAGHQGLPGHRGTGGAAGRVLRAPGSGPVVHGSLAGLDHGRPSARHRLAHLDSLRTDGPLPSGAAAHHGLDNEKRGTTMCGIVGYVGEKSAVGIIVDGLKRLEYRGYDSAGVAVIGAGGGLEVRRAAGRMKILEGVLRERPVAGRIGIGHTRWATHGRPSDENAHPHTDCSGSLVVVHNGIMENYLEIKERLTAEGHTFKSETDTEVLAHLIEHHLKTAGRLERAVKLALAEYRGNYAVGVVSTAAPDRLVAAKHGAGSVVVGLGKGEMFIASDIPAILAHTRDMVILEDGEVAVITATGV